MSFMFTDLLLFESGYENTQFTLFSAVPTALHAPCSPDLGYLCQYLDLISRFLVSSSYLL